MSTIQDYIEEARMATEAFGITSKHARVAWDVVEEKLAAASKLRNASRENHWKAFCEENPNSGECKIYDI